MIWILLRKRQCCCLYTPTHISYVPTNKGFDSQPWNSINPNVRNWFVDSYFVRSARTFHIFRHILCNVALSICKDNFKCSVNSTHFIWKNDRIFKLISRSHFDHARILVESPSQSFVLENLNKIIDLNTLKKYKKEK